MFIFSLLAGLSVYTPDGKVQQYTYAVVNYDGLPIELDETQLQPDKSESCGVILKRLKADDEFVISADISSVVGILLINSADEYTLGGTLLEKCRQCTKPIFLLTLSDGNTISSLLSSVSVFIKVELECQGMHRNSHTAKSIINMYSHIH